MQLRENLFYTHTGCCAYLLVDGNRAAAIDVGYRKHINQYIDLLKEAGNPELLDIFLTHRDRDHAGAVDELAKMTGARVYAHNSKRQGILKHLEAPIPDEYIPLNEGDELEIWGGCKVLYVPGHSPNQLAFYFYKESILFPGDALQIKRGKKVWAPWYLNSSHEQAKESFRRLDSLDVTDIYPGHRGPLNN
ncbi:MAG: MBL fold metallo-hydrolase [Nanoarchaeota archaeon]